MQILLKSSDYEKQFVNKFYLRKISKLSVGFLIFISIFILSSLPWMIFLQGGMIKDFLYIIFVVVVFLRTLVFLINIINNIRKHNWKIKIDLEKRQVYENNSIFSFEDKEFEIMKKSHGILKKDVFYTFGIDEGNLYLYYNLTDNVYSEIKSCVDKHFEEYKFTNLSK